MNSRGVPVKRPSFMAHHPGVLEQLPAHLTEDLEFVLTHRGAITRSLMNILSRNLLSGQSLNDFAEMVEESHMETYVRAHLKFGSAALYDNPVRQSLHEATLAPMDLPYKVPRGGYYSALYDSARECNVRRDHYQCQMSAVCGRFLKFDHVHEPAKHIRSNGARALKATAIAMNEYQQVFGFWHADTTSLLPIASELQGVVKRSLAAGSPIEVVYCDNVMQTKDVWHVVIPNLRYLRQDAIHFMMRYTRTMDAGHPLYAQFLQDISKCVFEWYPEDVAQLHKKMAGAGPHSTASWAKLMKAHCRRSIPEGNFIWSKLEMLMSRYSNIPPVHGDKVLVTKDTWKVHKDQEQLVKGQYLSGKLGK